MNNKDVLTKARSAVEDILNALDVARVVFVDDANGEEVSLEEVLSAAQSLDETLLLGAFPEFGDSIPDDPDVLVSRIRNLWVRMEPDIQLERAQAVVIAARRHDGGDADDAADVSILSQLIPDSRLINLSPSQWEEQKGQLLQEAGAQKTLFLFDRDFSEAGGDREGGIKIIASLLARDDTESLICGLLTHTVTPETQPQQWDEISTTHGIPKDRFIVIPKLHLSKAPMLFAQTLKYVALSPNFVELKRKTKEIIAQAADAAAERVESVSIYDLDHIVFQVSADEGLWEPDMLFRLHSMFHRLESRRLAHDGGELEEIASKLRAVSGIPTIIEPFPTPDNAWSLQRQEFYEPHDHINKNHFPIELGDIFEPVDGISAKKYILLAQPCDLMVRSNGKRSPELDRVPLAEVVQIQEGDEPPKFAEVLPYFDSSPQKKWYVKLKAIHFIRTCVLDMCVFNQEGRATIALEGDEPNNIRPAWKARYKLLSKCLKKEVRKADEILATNDREGNAVTQFKQQIASKVDRLLFVDDPFKGKIEDRDGVRVVSYNCKRIERLCRSRAIGLLMSYTSTIGRPAYEREFGEP